MYRFLIIDDEPVVREGIAGIIDWKAHGFELVGTCSDGREGLRAVEQLQPDVVLTDICMPFVDGLELASFIAEQYPNTKTIILTGYDEFEYAQEAVKLKVHDFLLKPITADELRTHLDRVHRELDADRTRQRQLDRLREQLRESLPILQERFLNHLVRSTMPPVELQKRLALLELRLPGPAFVALVCDTDRADGEDGLASFAVQNAILEVIHGFEDAVVFGTPKEHVVVLLSAETEAKAASLALDCAESISTRIVRDLGLTVSIGIGEPVPGIPRIPETYSDALTALEHRFVLGPNHIITVQQVRGAAEERVPPAETEARARFARGLKTGSPEESSNALKEIIHSYQNNGGSFEVCYTAMHRLLADALNGLEALGLDYRRITGLGLNPFSQLGRLKTLKDIQDWFEAFTRRAREHLEERRNRHSQVKAVAAEAFISANYMNPDLSLTQLCRELAVSKSYFSPLFKAHTGMTFVEYLTAVRMERAKELIASEDLKSYEVAERVGFNDAHYFSLTFKKQTGVTPTEYRELSRGTGYGRE